MTRDIAHHETTEIAGFSNRMPGIRLPSTPPTRVRRLVLWLFFLGFGLFGGLGAWAALAPMTSAVVAPGSFKVDGDSQVVQHLEGGIVREIAVSEGDVVNEGDVLAILDGTRSKAQMGILNSQLASALAEEQRLSAEFTSAERLQWSQELLDLVAADPTLKDVLSTQHDIYLSNREMIEGQVSILRKRVAQLEEQLTGAEARRSALRDQLSLIQDERADLKQLYEQGLTTKGRFIARQQDELEVIGQIGIVESNIQDIRQRMSEIEQRVLQVRRDLLLDIAADRQQVRDRILDVRQRIDATRDIQNRLTIRAPVGGRILGLQVNTLGQVIEPGQTLLEIVPVHSSFVVETRVRPSDIDQVTEGGSARIRLTAYSFRKTPAVAGEVVHVSADTFTDQSGNTYYRVDVKIPDSELSSLPGVQTLPGMPAQVMLETGEQTLMTYLLDPVIGGMETALTEK